MQLIKKHLIIGISAISLVVIFALFALYKYINSPVLPAINAIPTNSAILIKTNNLRGFWDALMFENKLVNSLEKIPEIESALGIGKHLDSLIQKNEEIENILERENCYLSIFQNEKGNVETLFVSALSNAHQKGEIRSFLQESISTDLDIKKVKKSSLFCICSPSDTLLYFSVDKGIFILSKTETGVIASQKQLNSGKCINENSYFDEVLAVAGKNVDANIFINYAEIQLLTNSILENKNGEFVETLSNFAPFTELDIYVKYDRFLMNGFSTSGNNSILGVFNGQDATTDNCGNILPKQSSAFIRYGFSDIKMLLSAQQNRLEKEFKETEKRRTKIYGKNLHDELFSCFKDEIIFAYIIDSPIVLIKCKSKSKADLLLKIGRKNNKEYSFGEKKIYNSGASLLFRELKIPFLSNSENGWHCFYKDYVVVANSAATLRAYLKAMSKNETLNENSHYADLEENMENKSNVSIFFDIKNGYKFAKNNLQPEIFNFIKSNFNTLQKFDGFAAQLTGSDGMFYTNAVLQYGASQKDSEEIYDVFHEIAETEVEEEKNEEVITEEQAEEQVFNNESVEIEEVKNRENWTISIDAQIVGQPKFIRDHKTGELKIIAFDSKKQMYLIDKNGEIVWKIKLKELPISGVNQVDFYTNGKIQYLFNTKNYIYCIDLLGRNVSNYPVKLPVSASNPIAVFDYNHKRDYRIFWVGTNNTVYCYNKKGVAQKGWRNPKTDYKVSSPVEYMNSKGNRYILIPMNNGNVLLTSTTGNLRMKIEQSFSNALGSNFYINHTNSKGIILTTDKSGKLIYVPEKGAIKRTDFGDFSANHKFLYADFNGDNSSDFIYLDGTKLRVFDRLKNVLLSYTFPIEITQKPIIFKDRKGQKYLGVISEKENRIYLFDKNGLVKKILPKGKTAFDSGNGKSKKGSSLVSASGETIFFYSL